MNDEQIGKVYTDGNNESHTAALRAVYNAGRNHDTWVKEQEAAKATAEKAAAKLAKVSATAAVPTKAQIDAARSSARTAGMSEGLKGAKLDAVQDEAEAELVAKMARGETVDV